MKLLKAIIGIVLLLLVATMIITPFLAVSNQPQVASYQGMNLADIERARAILKRSDPRGMEPGQVRTLALNEDELLTILNYGLSQFGGGGARLNLHAGTASLQVTYVLPDNPIGHYLNMQIILSQSGQTVSVDYLKMGDLEVPGWIADPVRKMVHDNLLRIPEYAAALEAVNGFRITKNNLFMIYQWRPELVASIRDRGKGFLISDADQERMLAYARQLNATTRAGSFGRSVSLIEVMKPLFKFADLRGGDPVEENRALLMVLSMYISGVDVPKMLGIPTGTLESPRQLKLTLQGRHDFAQHFLTSAALTLAAGQALADTVGLFKEIEDSKGGSGFSFTDLGADRSGVRMAEQATQSKTDARLVQQIMNGNVEESDFIPALLDLPELMPEDQFKALYGGVGAPAYNQVVADIERRIANCRMYQN